jgi:hypothetical protein
MLTNLTVFAEIRWIRSEPNSKIGRIYCSQIKIFKKSGKYYKKTRANSKHFGEEIFANLHHLFG